MEITAKLNDYRQSPRKVRLVASLLKGKKVEEAKNSLSFLVKRASSPLLNLLNSAIANAKNNFSLDEKELYIKDFRVDAGVTLKRRMPRARGMAYPINKRTSHVLIKLDTIDNLPTKKSKTKNEKPKVEVKNDKLKKASKKLQATS